MYPISAISSISHQPTFQNERFSENLLVLPENSLLLNPDYKQFIASGLIRRMSKILRMAVSCATDSLRQAGLEQPDAIIVGTGLGCLLDTEKFLNNAITLEGMLPPTSFIQSTHNTIAGQISLNLGNHGYNMTHTQNTVSFEHALIDSMLLLEEDSKSVLVGAADETIPFLKEVAHHLIPSYQNRLTSGTTFLVLNKTLKNTRTQLVDTEVHTGEIDKIAVINSFLDKNKVALDGIDLIASPEKLETNVAKIFTSETRQTIAFLPYSGYYATAAAFGFHLLVDKLSIHPRLKYALLVNDMTNTHLGLTLIKNCEA